VLSMTSVPGTSATQGTRPGAVCLRLPTRPKRTGRPAATRPPSSTLTTEQNLRRAQPDPARQPSDERQVGTRSRPGP
jgi:hypothetical protein